MSVDRYILLSWFDSLEEADQVALLEALESGSADRLTPHLVESYPHDLLQIATLVSSE